jgi:hypothetical protein
MTEIIGIIVLIIWGTVFLVTLKKLHGFIFWISSGVIMTLETIALGPIWLFAILAIACFWWGFHEKNKPKV